MRHFLRKLYFILFILSILILSCKKDEIPKKIPPQNYEQPKHESNLDIKSFIWSALKIWYYWADSQPLLKNFTNLGGFYPHLGEYKTPNDLFDLIKVKQDRFSYITDNYHELENTFKGIEENYGAHFSYFKDPNTNEFLLYVLYVLKNSPSDLKGLKRGDVFSKINGVTINEKNAIGFFLGKNAQVTLTYARKLDDAFITQGKSITLNLYENQEDPVLLSKVIEVSGKKIGYLVYNQFVYTDQRHKELHGIFADFKTQNISDLVLDLRYNPGGFGYTANLIASMIAPVNENQVFYKDKFNSFAEKITDESDVTSFFLNSSEIKNAKLNLNRLFVLTSKQTASSSELVINGLSPYISVKIIGDKTRGKNQGSYTLYDSPSSRYLTKRGINKNHTWAIQPIVMKVVNSLGFGDYEDGLNPDYSVKEINYLYEEGILEPLGSENEPLLSKAIELISGKPSKKIRRINDLPIESFHYNILQDLGIILNKEMID